MFFEAHERHTEQVITYFKFKRDLTWKVLFNKLITILNSLLKKQVSKDKFFFMIHINWIPAIQERREKILFKLQSY